MSGFRPRFFVTEQDPPFSGQTSAGLETDLSGGEVLLSPEDSHHALRVLRLNAGDRCEVVVGSHAYLGVVTKNADSVGVRLTARLEGEDAGAGYRIQVGIVQALARPAIVDHVLEKGTEVGASFFLLVQAAGSPRWSDPSRGDRLTRWQRIAREAAKQSKQLVVPWVETASSIGQGLALLGERGVGSLLLEPSAPARLQQVLSRPGVERRGVALWVGPEGGWTAAESEQFLTAGAEPVRLGRSILRSETAGPVAVAVARMALGDW